MSESASPWLKKTGPYGRVTLRRAGFHPPQETFNYSLAMSQSEQACFKRPPPRKSCLLTVDRKRLLPSPNVKVALPNARISVAGRKSSRLPTQSEVGAALRHPRQSVIPPRPRQSFAPQLALAKKSQAPRPAPILKPQETTNQVSSTPQEQPIHSILRSAARPPSRVSSAAKRVNFDGLEGIEPLQISDILPIDESTKNPPIKVDAATNTDPLPPAMVSAMDIDNLPEMMQTMLSLCGTMQSFLSRLDAYCPQLLQQQPTIRKPVFLENLEDISEKNENSRQASDEIVSSNNSPTMADSKMRTNVFTQTGSSIEELKAETKVLQFSPVVETHEFDGEKSEYVPPKRARVEEDEMKEQLSEESDEETPAWPEPKFAVDITPNQIRRSTRLATAISPGRHLRDGHKKVGGLCNRNCC